MLLLKVAKTFIDEIERIKQQLSELEQEIYHNAQGVQRGVLQIAQRLEQIRNILTSKHTLSGDLAEVYSIEEGGSYIRIYHSETEFVPTPISSSLIEPKPGKLPLVQFTAFHSRTVTTETWNTFLVYAHLESALLAMRADTQHFRHEARDYPQEVQSRSSLPLARETTIVIIPTCQGITFNPDYTWFKWMEDWHRASFRFLVEKERAGSAMNGEVSIYAGPLLIAIIPLAFLVEKQKTQDPSEDSMTENTTSLYKQIFTSYSHADTPIVLACRNAYKALGFDVLIDIDTLRALP